MQARYALVDQALALLNGIVDSGLANSGLVISGGTEGTQELGGKSASRCQVGHSVHPRKGGDGHNSCHDGQVDSGEVATVPVIKEVVIVEKELSADVVGACVGLRLEMVHLCQAILCRRMSLWKPGHPDLKGMGVVLQKTNQIDGVFEMVLLAIVVGLIAGRVSPEGQNGPDVVARVLVQDFRHFSLGMTDAGKMGNGGDTSLAENSLDDCTCPLSGCSTGTIGDADKGWIELPKFVHRF